VIKHRYVLSRQGLVPAPTPPLRQAVRPVNWQRVWQTGLMGSLWGMVLLVAVRGLVS